MITVSHTTTSTYRWARRMFHLRMIPFEHAWISGEDDKWRNYSGDVAFEGIPEDCGIPPTFIEYPLSQSSATFSIDQIVEEIEEKIGQMQRQQKHEGDLKGSNGSFDCLYSALYRPSNSYVGLACWGNKHMKTFLGHLRDIAISGFLAILPLYVLFIVIAKAWKALSSVGAGVAGMFGLKSMLGVGGGTVFSGLLVITIWIVIGLLVRFSFVTALSRAAERTLSKYLPGYDTYKAIAEEKLQHKERALAYTSALIRWQEYWRPVYIVEKGEDGTCVLFLPDVPETNTGHVLLASQDQVRIVSSITANQLDASLKKMGKGLCSENKVSS